MSTLMKIAVKMNRKQALEEFSKASGVSKKKLKKMSKEELKRLSKRVARKHHPDHGGSAEAFKKTRAAYDNLAGNDDWRSKRGDGGSGGSRWGRSETMDERNRQRSYQGNKERYDKAFRQYNRVMRPMLATPLAVGGLTSVNAVRNKGKKSSDKLKRRMGKGYIGGAIIGAGGGLVRNHLQKDYQPMDAINNAMAGANIGGVIGAGAGAGYHGVKEASLVSDVKYLADRKATEMMGGVDRKSEKRRKKDKYDYLINSATGSALGLAYGEFGDISKVDGVRDKKRMLMNAGTGAALGALKTGIEDLNVRHRNSQIDKEKRKYKRIKRRNRK